MLNALTDLRNCCAHHMHYLNRLNIKITKPGLDHYNCPPSSQNKEARIKQSHICVMVYTICGLLYSVKLTLLFCHVSVSVCLCLYCTSTATYKELMAIRKHIYYHLFLQYLFFRKIHLIGFCSLLDGFKSNPRLLHQPPKLNIGPSTQ